ncbi:MAG: hypothetical protein FIB07_03825 [Candidatus Methanoperedens sp.]|nr:hypothetical protein [Candidatus Methanoperedens sp.]
MPGPEVIKKNMEIILQEIKGKVPYYTPEWTFTDETNTDPGAALAKIFAQMSEIAIKKLNDAPQRHFLSFLETINASLIPARPARAPLTFLLSKGTPENVLIPALTQVAGQGADGKPVLFETEKNIIATPSKLVSVFSIIDNNYLFNWDEIPGNENNSILEFLARNYDVEWARSGTITKQGNDIIKITSAGNPDILFKLNNITGKVKLEIGTDASHDLIDRTDEFTARIENGRLNVYKQDEIFDHTVTIDGTGSSGFFEGKNRQEHILYIGDKNRLNVTTARIQVEGKGSQNLSNPLNFSWEYGTEVTEKIDGKEIKTVRWNILAPANKSSWLPLVKSTDEPISEIEINGIKSRWIRCRVINSRISLARDMQISGLDISTSPYSPGIKPDMAFMNDVPVDVTKNIYPFGKKPQIYNTFYIACDDAFSKTGYIVEISFDLTPGKTAGSAAADKKTANNPQLSWEYWDGMGWNCLEKLQFKNTPDNWAGIDECIETPGEKASVIDTAKEEQKRAVDYPKIIIPSMPTAKPTTVNGQEKYWIRVRLVGGDYGKEYMIKNNQVEPGSFCPPMLSNLRINYIKNSAGQDKSADQPDYILSKNNLVFKNCLDELNTGKTFKPFESIPDNYPSLYFGFDKPLKGGPFSLFISIDENTDYSENKRPSLKWQYLSKNSQWLEPDILDETNGFIKSEMVQFVISGEMVSEKIFTTNDLYWIRAQAVQNPVVELKDIHTRSKLLGLYLNSAWALQSRTVAYEITGSSTGESRQVFRLMNTPVLSEKILVNEYGTLTEIERKALGNNKYIDEKKNDSGNVTEFWVKWDEVPYFLDSVPKDRHYIIDRTTGEIRFGDGVHGMIPSIGYNNIKAIYSTGGGKTGNIPARKISKLQGTIAFVDKVYNPVASDGGADTEEVDTLTKRAPSVLKHRNRAVALQDYQMLVKEASNKVARVKILPNLSAEGTHMPGTITIVIVPGSMDAKPVPSPELRHIVERYVSERCSNLAKLNVVQPSYIVVKVSAILVTHKIDTIPVIEQKAKSQITGFLHPLFGGLEGKGWDFGAVPCISDIFPLFEKIEDVDYVSELKIQLYDEDSSKLTEITRNSDNFKLPADTLLYSGEHDISAKWIPGSG